MCDICHRNPCVSGCPNSINEPVESCAECGEDLYIGQQVYYLSDICDKCFCDKQCLLSYLTDEGIVKQITLGE